MVSCDLCNAVVAAITQNSYKVGSIEKGKFADLIATSGDPLEDITEIERVKFVMKGGAVIKDDLGAQNDETRRSAAK